MCDSAHGSGYVSQFLVVESFLSPPWLQQAGGTLPPHPAAVLPGDEARDCGVVSFVSSVEGKDWRGFCGVDVKVCLGKVREELLFPYFFILFYFFSPTEQTDECE